MENEFQILNNIEKNNNITQRDLAKSTGMSLGNVNILIKRLVKKGLLKIERLNPRAIRYILTPEGLKQKAELTYNYVVISFRYINEINLKIDSMLYTQGSHCSHYILVGDHDEVYHILVNKLNYIKATYKHGAFRVLAGPTKLFTDFLMWYREEKSHINYPMTVHQFQNRYEAMVKIPLE